MVLTTQIKARLLGWNLGRYPLQQGIFFRIITSFFSALSAFTEVGANDTEGT
jgi:hypothetical protein